VAVRRFDRRAFCATCLAAGGSSLARCATRANDRAERLVFTYQPLGFDSHLLESRLRAFERMHPGLVIESQLLPSASDTLHQYYLTALEGGARHFDVLVADVIWIAEFARAGWITDLSAWFPADRVRRDFVAGAADAVIVDGRTFAIPWYVDVGLLYYRRDVTDAPRTTDDLERIALSARARDDSMRGYVWQGRQSEGLVCVGCEAIWAFGGDVMQAGLVRIDTPAARGGLEWLRRLVERGISPVASLSADEEASRRLFQAGHVLFMRNWPYAWRVLERADSALRGRVAIAPIPTRTGSPGSGALGGWQLAVNAHAPAWKRRIASELIAYLTSTEAGVDLALAYGRNPPQNAAYDDARLAREAPFIAQLAPFVRAARPRPITPYYNVIADTLQSEFSAIVTGVRSARDALARAQRRIDDVMEGVA
jgi:multiple sugar transport system substrate-binding protein